MFCLQEIWLSGTQFKIRDGICSIYPHVVMAAELAQDTNGDDGIPACDSHSMDMYENCSAVHCPSLSFSIYCMVKNCLSTLRQLPRYCMACLLFGPPHGQSCLTTPAEQYWSTSSGLMLLSKQKLTNVRVQNFLPDPLAQHHGAIRGYIQAQVMIAAGATISLSDSVTSVPVANDDAGCWDRWGHLHTSHFHTGYRVW